MSDGPYVSRSHRWPYSLIARHAAPVGVDIERIDPLGREFADSICTPQERGRLGALLGDDRLVASLWSAKEALAKALGDALRYDPRRLDSPLLWEGGACGRWRARQLDVPDGHVGWLVWAVSEEAPGAGATAPGLSETAPTVRVLRA